MSPSFPLHCPPRPLLGPLATLASFGPAVANSLSPMTGSSGRKFSCQESNSSLHQFFDASSCKQWTHMTSARGAKVVAALKWKMLRVMWFVSIASCEAWVVIPYDRLTCTSGEITSSKELERNWHLWATVSIFPVSLFSLSLCPGGICSRDNPTGFAGRICPLVPFRPPGAGHKLPAADEAPRETAKIHLARLFRVRREIWCVCAKMTRK